MIFFIEKNTRPVIFIIEKSTRPVIFSIEKSIRPVVLLIISKNYQISVASHICYLGSSFQQTGRDFVGETHVKMKFLDYHLNTSLIPLNVWDFGQNSIKTSFPHSDVEAGPKTFPLSLIRTPLGHVNKNNFPYQSIAQSYFSYIVHVLCSPSSIQII